MSKIPFALRNSLGALMLLIGMGSATYYVDQAATAEAQKNQYIQAVAADPGVSDAVRIAMVMGSYYESSNRHIGTPYIDKLGKGQPLTVCNGITGAGVIEGRWYSPAECYRLEKGRYLAAERTAMRVFVHWASYDDFARATFIDFIHNKGETNLSTSTLLRKANAGDLEGSCRENPRWSKGTVNGVQTVLPGLKLRGEANDEICRLWRMPLQPINLGK